MKKLLKLKRDLRDLPTYSYSEASRALRIPRTTLRAWTRGQQRFQRVFTPAGDASLSYFNLIEAQVLRAIRNTPEHPIPMPMVRKALQEASKEYGIERLLIHRDFRFGAGDLFLDQYSHLVSLTLSRQIVLKRLLDAHLARVEYGDDGLPRQFFPMLHGDGDQPKEVEINPFVSFGRAVVIGTGISTQAINSRVDAGESIEFVATDYEITVRQVEDAIYYEAA